MKKLIIKAFAILSIFTMIITFSPQSSAIGGGGDGDCLDDGFPPSLNFDQNNYDNPLNCSYAGIGCTTCTSTPIE